MILLLALVLHLVDPYPKVDVFVASGKETKIPDKFIAIEDLESTEIGQSYWIKVLVKNSEEGHFILRGGNWYMQGLEFYSEEGSKLGHGNRTLVHLSGEKQIFYIYYAFPDEKDSSLFTVSLLPEAEFLRIQQDKNVFQAAFFSILFFLLIITFYFGGINNDKVYVYYGLYILSIIVFFGYQYGIIGTIIPSVQRVPPMWFWLFAFTTSLFYILFSVYFLDLRSRDPWAMQLVRVGITFILLLFVTSTVLYLLRIDVQHAYWYKVPIWLFQLITIPLFVFRIIKLPGRLKKYYLAGAFILVAVSLMGQVGSTIKALDNVNYFIQTGLILEVMILFLGLGVRVVEIRKSKEKAQRELIEQMKLTESLQREYTEKLEEKVKERTSIIERRNQENELLLKEVHHRVKNNLQMITSLINIQERRIESASLRELLTGTKNKIKSIALIHEHLYNTEDFSNIHLPQYCNRLLDMLVGSLSKGNEVDLEVNIADCHASLDTAIPIGLILNELVTNSLKYAVPKVTNPLIRLDIYEENDLLHIDVIDNGPGLVENGKSEGLGFTIIKTILASHEGEINIKRETNLFQVSIQLEQYKIHSVEVS